MNARQQTEPSAGRDADEPVPLAVVPHPIAGHLLCSVLESRGINAVVVGEHTATNVMFFSPVGTATVQVRRDDYDPAVRYLAEAFEDAGRMDKGAPARCLACGYDMKGIEGQERCPECGTAWSALAKLRNTIAIAPPPRAPGDAAMVQRIGVGLAWPVVVVGIAAVIAIVVVLLMESWGLW